MRGYKGGEWRILRDLARALRERDQEQARSGACWLLAEHAPDAHLGRVSRTSLCERLGGNLLDWN